MERFTTDTPQGNTSSALNLFYIKDGETWVRGGGTEPDYADVRLYDYIREVVETLKADIDAGLSDDDLGECLYELLADGNSTMEGVVATLYMAAWAFSSLRAKLAAYEDAGTIDEFRDALRRTAEDDKAREEGRLVELPCKVGDTVFARGYKCVEELKIISRARLGCGAEGDDGKLRFLDWDVFGKTVFLTRQAAEAALGGGKGG